MIAKTTLESDKVIRRAFQKYFVIRERWDISAILEQSVVSLDHNYSRLTNHDRFIFSVVLPERALRLLKSEFSGPGFRKCELKNALRDAAESFFSPGYDVQVAVTLLSEETEEETIGLNNCFFKTDSIIEHDELRFRSEVEAIIYDELKKRDLLVCPNPAAILGGAEHEKREPDFLICHRGKLGILEVMSDAFHKNAAKDHDRARLFKKYGVLCIEFFTANECKFSPQKVVDKFLTLLERH